MRKREEQSERETERNATNTRAREPIGSNALFERAAEGWVCEFDTKRRCTSVGCGLFGSSKK
jgi:hypothetical protein